MLDMQLISKEYVLDILVELKKKKKKLSFRKKLN